MAGTLKREEIEAILAGKANGFKLNGLCKLHKVAGNLILEFEKINDLPYESTIVTLHSTEYEGIRDEIKNAITQHMQDITDKLISDL